MSTLKLFLMILLFGFTSCSLKSPDEEELRIFIEKHVEQVKPLLKQEHLAYWNAATTGADDEYERYSRLQIKIKKIMSDRDGFEFLSKLRESGNIEDPLLARQLDILYHSFLENQIDTTLMTQIVEASTAIEKDFSTFRAVVGGEEVTDNDIRRILKEETDPELRREAWEGSKQIGGVVAARVIDLAKKRNEAARNLGFENFFDMQLTLNEQDEEEIVRIFDELDTLTGKSFRAVKSAIDNSLAGRYGIEPKDMMPWHYHDPFFQEVPDYLDIDLDSFFKGRDIVEISTEFYDGIGLEVDDILARSDLYEREKKYQHAFCTDIDREGDVRIIVNIKDNANWAETTLHELGHAVYDKYIDMTLPFLLRSAAHTFTTEGVAMLMGRQVKNPEWLQTMVGITEEEKEQTEKSVRMMLTSFELIFSRWCQVMFRFEREFYRDPDQDLNALWWELVERYQGLTKPEGRDAPDWAAKIHVALYPVYYHNYMLGELYASQIQSALAKEVLKLESEGDISFAGHPEVGKYLIERVFRPGASMPWEEFVVFSTGEKLTASHFANQFVTD